MNVNAPEVELVRRAKAGDLAAFEDLTTRHEQRVYTLALRIVQNPQDAEDATQLPRRSGLSEANVKMRLLPARLQLREQLTRTLGDPQTRRRRAPHPHG